MLYTGYDRKLLSVHCKKRHLRCLMLMDDDNHFFDFYWLFITEYDPCTFAKAQSIFLGSP